MKTKFSEGETVYWKDPDGGICSGLYKITEIHGEIYKLDNLFGSEVEALIHEIERYEGTNEGG